MNPCFLTTFVLTVELTKGKRSSRSRKRNKPRLEGSRFAPTLSVRNYQRLDFMRSFGYIIPAKIVGAL